MGAAILPVLCVNFWALIGNKPPAWLALMVLKLSALRLANGRFSLMLLSLWAAPIIVLEQAGGIHRYGGRMAPLLIGKPFVPPWHWPESCQKPLPEKWSAGLE